MIKQVNLTWDETDQDRIKVTMRNPSQSGKKTDDVNEEDFKAFLASSSEEEADDGTVISFFLTDCSYGKGSFVIVGGLIP